MIGSNGPSSINNQHFLAIGRSGERAVSDFSMNFTHHIQRWWWWEVPTRRSRRRSSSAPPSRRSRRETRRSRRPPWSASPEVRVPCGPVSKLYLYPCSHRSLRGCHTACNSIWNYSFTRERCSSIKLIHDYFVIEFQPWAGQECRRYVISCLILA